MHACVKHSCPVHSDGEEVLGLQDSQQRHHKDYLYVGMRLRTWLGSWNSQGWLRRRRLLERSMISPKEALSSLVCRAMKLLKVTPCTATAVALMLISGASSLHSKGTSHSASLSMPEQ